MLEKAINLINKQREMYIIQLSNLSDNIRTKTIQKATSQLRKEIQVFDYILEILNKQKKWGVLFGKIK